MRKILSLMLVLCMALAAIPAFAETDFTGTWYIVMTGMNLGTCELKADGTCIGTSDVEGTAKNCTGTWSAEGDAVSLTFGEQTMALTFDGTDLVFNEVATDKDAASILKLTRDAGIATVDELNAYIAKGTIPEGKTKEEMEAVVENVGLLFLAAAFAPEETPDYSGTWYLGMMDLSFGAFELNADGTFTGTSGIPGVEVKVNGTWTANGRAVKLTVADQSTRMYYNGTNLVLSKSELYTSTDSSMVDAFLKLSRTPGVVTVDELNAFTSKGIIPEGKTKEEMEAIQEQLGMLYIVAALME